MLAMVMAILIGSVAAVNAAAQVSNGDFSQGLEGWTVQTEGEKITAAQTGGREDSAALFFDCESEAVHYASTTLTGLSVNKSYAVRAWCLFLPDAETLGNERVEIGISQENCSSNDGYRFIRDYAVGEWFEIERTFVASAETQDFWFGFRGPGQAYLDDVTVTELETVPVVANGNGNLENGNAGWTCNSTGNWDVRTGGRNESNAIYINLGSSTSSRIFTAPIANVEAGKLYTVRLWVKVNGTGYTAGNSAHIGIGQKEEGTFVRYYYFDNIVKDTWVELKYAFIAAGDGTDQLMIKFRGKAIGYIDDCSVSEGGNYLDAIGLSASYSGDFMYTTDDEIGLASTFAAFGWAKRSQDTWGTHLFYDTETYASYPASMKIRIPADEGKDAANYIHGYYATLGSADFGAGKYKLSFKMKANLANETVATYDDSVKLSVSQTEEWETKVFYLTIPEGGTEYITLRTARDEDEQKETIVWFDDITVEKLENESGFLDGKGEEINSASAGEAVQAFISYAPTEGETAVYVKAVYGMRAGTKYLQDISIVPITEAFAEISPCSFGEGNEIKLMVWDSIGSMQLKMPPAKLSLQAE